MERNFSSHDLAEIFRDLYLRESSGVLLLARGAAEKRIYFDRGMILYAESSVDDEDLGRRLVAEGKISQGALGEARRNVVDAKDLPQALINRGLIGKETLAHTVHFVVERIVQSVFRWDGGSARFSEGWLLQEIFESDVLTTFEVILGGIATMVGFEPIQQALESLDSRLRVKTPLAVPLEKLALSPAHGFILSRVDGNGTVKDVLATLPPAEEEVACRFLYGLLVMGILALDPAPTEGPFQIASILRDRADQLAMEHLQEEMIKEAYESLKNKNALEILRVSPDASREDVEAAYHQAKERFGRNRLAPRIRDRFRSELAVIDSRMLEAYLTHCQIRPKEGSSSEPPSPPTEVPGADGLLVRVEHDKTRAKREIEENVRIAEGYFLKARKFMKEGDFHNAIQYGKLAISYSADDARFHFLLAECHVRNPEARWQRAAEQHYNRATELDGWNAEYRVGLGRFYKKRGLKLRARKQFEEALQIVPDHETARRELQELR